MCTWQQVGKKVIEKQSNTKKQAKICKYKRITNRSFEHLLQFLHFSLRPLSDLVSPRFFLVLLVGREMTAESPSSQSSAIATVVRCRIVGRRGRRVVDDLSEGEVENFRIREESLEVESTGKLDGVFQNLSD